MSPATYARLDQLHRQDLLAGAARARRVAKAAQAEPAAPKPWPPARARFVLRRAAAAVAAVGIGLASR